jgi:hypothetical protein
MPKAEDNEARLPVEKLRAVVDQRRAHELRLQWLSYEQIGRVIGCTATAARIACARHGRRVKSQNSEQLQSEFVASIGELLRREMWAASQCEEVIRFRGAKGSAHPQAMEAHARLASHVRTMRQLIAEAATITGVRVNKHELTGVNGGPIHVAHDDVLAAIRAAEENLNAIEAEGRTVGETEH